MAEPTFEKKNTSSNRVAGFLNQPLSEVESTLSLSRSETFGLRSQDSTTPVTIPAAIAGFSDVKGAATMALKIVSG